MTDAEVRLEDGPGQAAVAVRRAGALALLQRPGEVQVLQDSFEAIDPARWTKAGACRPSSPTRTGKGPAASLPTDGASLSGRLDEPVDSGRLDLFYNDGGSARLRPALARRADVPAPDGGRADPGGAGLGGREPGGRVAAEGRP